MAVPAKLVENKSPQGKSEGIQNVLPEDRAACEHAAKLYGRGHTRTEIAKVLAKVLYQDREWPEEHIVQVCRRRLRSWEAKQWFRDLVWDEAVVELDMSTPQILRGVAAKAKRGRVDAAKLVLGITGRYQEKSSDVPAAVTINLNAIPRPERQAVEAGEGAEEIAMGEVVDED